MLEGALGISIVHSTVILRTSLVCVLSKKRSDGCTRAHSTVEACHCLMTSDQL